MAVNLLPGKRFDCAGRPQFHVAAIGWIITATSALRAAQRREMSGAWLRKKFCSQEPCQLPRPPQPVREARVVGAIRAVDRDWACSRTTRFSLMAREISAGVVMTAAVRVSVLNAC